MRRKRIGAWVVLAVFFAVEAVFCQNNYKVESIGPPAPTDLPEALSASLEAGGARVVDDQGNALCEVWLRKSIAGQASGGEASIVYGRLGAGSLVGVVRFPKGGSDFRGQPIKPGSYTMRYALIPQDGNHMGVSPYRDFLLLSPVAADKQLDQALSFDAVVKLSRLASGTGHPTILSLTPASEAGTVPNISHDDQGRWVLLLQLKTKDASGDHSVPLAIVVMGKSEAA